ncbi:Predicted membrane protein [Ceraceosorus bombacis]|uniref:Predicted membrane protein n=1 Tax=Ceraceosorus bombacis TaxID=401625 RepID=A0A0P1BHZ0_9BASI|nr:Predicted membrane protein [Ceraceosorus bombacis]
MQFYFALTCAYILLGAYWGYLCVKHRDDLLMVQYFISGLLGLMVVSTAATWGYQRFLNTHIIDFWSISSLEGKSSVTGTARFLLVLTSVLDATKTSASLAILLCVSMGLSVVRPSIGPVMRRVQILTGIHFVCGVLYSVGIVLILIDSGGAFIFLFIFPLAFTLSTFMMWTLHALNGTIEHLTARKQTFKKNMFTKLYRILLGAVVAIGIFFVMSSVAFARVGGESAAEAWPYRWLLMDGWLGSLYFVVFSAIAALIDKEKEQSFLPLE